MAKKGSGIEELLKIKRKISEMSTAERFVAGCKNPGATLHQKKAILLVMR
jgi:hypothetical protein